MKETIILELPLPPSVNLLFAWYPKRHKSNKYKEWINLASYSLVTQTKYKISGDEWLEADFVFHMPLYYKNWSKKRIDLDNYIKATQDFLVEHIEWFKDENIVYFTAKKIDSKTNLVKILIKEIWTNTN